MLTAVLPVSALYRPRLGVEINPTEPGVRALDCV